MVASSSAAPPTPWSKTLAEPTIHPSAYVHSFSNLIGDVHLSANVMVSPGTSIRADEGSPFFIGAGTNVQDGVVIHGLAQGRVLGEDGNPYSVWIGKNTSITHLCLIHGPCYVGDECFIGFRSTLFNARVNAGCIVMMHVLIQDVEIPPGRYVPSGSVITTQQQADQLPPVQPTDVKFAQHMVGVNHALRQGYHCADNLVCISPLRAQRSQSSASPSSSASASASAASQSSRAPNGSTMSPNGFSSHRLSPELQDQIRTLLAQGYRIGTEHADARRFRTSSWISGGSIDSSQPGDVIQALEQMMAQYGGEYVKVIGIDPKAKRRVLEQIVQHPGDAPAPAPAPQPSYTYTPPATPTPSYPPASAPVSPATGTASGEGSVSDHVRGLLNQGYRVGLEFADKRRFRTSSWQSGPAIQSSHFNEVISTIQSAVASHPEDYVRLLGIDPRQKRRVLEQIIHYPGGQPAPLTSSQPQAPSSAPVSGYGVRAFAHEAAPAGIQDQVRGLLSQGYRVALEFADKRRFRTSSWQSGPTLQSPHLHEVMSTIQSALASHPGEYVRLLGIDPRQKRRVLEQIIHYPEDQSLPSQPHGGETTGSSGAAAAYRSPLSQPPMAPIPQQQGYSSSYGSSGSSSYGGSSGYGGGRTLTPQTREQVRYLLNQGYRIGTEHADARRFRTSSWKSCSPIASNREPEVVSALEACLEEHAGEYVRLLGIDPKAKRRVLEEIIQYPND